MDAQKFKAMTFGQKCAHLWEYYHWQALAVLLVLALAVPWIWGALSETEPLLRISMIDCYGNSSGSEAFREFLESRGLEYEEDAVILDRAIQMSGTDEAVNAGSAEMLFCAISSGETDLFFWRDRDCPPALGRGILRDLRQVFPPEYLEGKELVYAEDPETGEDYPCGIYLDHHPWIENNLYYVTCSVGIPYSTHDTDLPAEFIRYLLP